MEGKFKTWIISLDKNKAPISETKIYFNATSDLKNNTGKNLPYSWIKSLNYALKKYSNYHLNKCISKIVSPDNKDMTEYMILAILAFKKPSIKVFMDKKYYLSLSETQIYDKVGLLISISEDNQVGLFGLKPYELFLSVLSKPMRIKTLESLIIDRPNFWEDVFLLVTSDYDWSSIFTQK